MLLYKDLKPFHDHKSFEIIINKCHNIIRDEEFSTPEQVFDELSKILFCKIFDEQEVINGDKPEIEFFCSNDETEEDVAYRISGRALNEIENKGIYNTIKRKYPKIFDSGKNEIREIGLKPSTLKRLVLELQEYNLSETDLDIKGSAYQVLIKSTYTGGKGLGQFFTPREIVKFIVHLINPKKDELLIDPACGTGGFLVEAISYVSEQTKGLSINYAKEKVHGIDANEKMAWTAQINMIFHNDGEGHILRWNSLENNWYFKNLKVVKESYNVIITNPPFGARETNRSVLENYYLGSKIDVRKSQSAEILFIEKCLELLKPGGRMGIILPDGILSNSSLEYVRSFIMDNAILIGIISLPEETFKPYGTSVKTSILIMKKKELTNEVQTSVFMGQINTVGYDSTGKTIESSDLNNMEEAFNNFRREYYAEVFL